MGSPTKLRSPKKSPRKSPTKGVKFANVTTDSESATDPNATTESENSLDVLLKYNQIISPAKSNRSSISKRSGRSSNKRHDTYASSETSAPEDDPKVVLKAPVLTPGQRLHTVEELKAQAELKHANNQKRKATRAWQAKREAAEAADKLQRVSSGGVTKKRGSRNPSRKEVMKALETNLLLLLVS